jgi:hypothetical protein
MDQVPITVIIASAALLRSLADWLEEVSTQRQLGSLNITKNPERPEKCFHASCLQKATYFGRCQQHAPTPGVHYCTKCWRVRKAHPAGEPCPDGEFEQAAPKQRSGN